MTDASRPPRDHAIQCPHKWGDKHKRCICDDPYSIDGLLFIVLLPVCSGLLILAALSVPYIVYH